MSTLLYRYAFLLPLILNNHLVAQQPIFNNGDRVCFVGDSHTMSGSYPYFIQLFYATRHPASDVAFYNCGISGDVTSGVLKRMDSDILVHRPTWCVLMIGGNDIRERLYSDANKTVPDIKEQQQAAMDNYYKGADSIIKRLLAANVKVILLTDPIYEETAKIPAEVFHGVNDVEEKLALNWKAAGLKYHLPVVDIWTILGQINSKIQLEDSTATIIGPDRNHLGKQGHLVIAYQFLKTLGETEKVSLLSIDARNNKILKQVNANVRKLNANTAGASFDLLENALPFPTEPGLKLDSLIPFTQDLNQENLQMKGLVKGKYQISIDRVAAGVFSEQELEKGINISLDTLTAQYLQADTVRELVMSYREVDASLRAIKFVEYEHLSAFKGRDNLEEVKVFFTNALAKYKATADANFGFFTKMYDKYLANKPQEKELESKLVLLRKRIREASVPKWHRYVVARIP